MVLFHIGLTDIGVAGAEVIGGIKIVGSTVGVADVGKFHAVVAFSRAVRHGAGLLFGHGRQIAVRLVAVRIAVGGRTAGHGGSSDQAHYGGECKFFHDVCPFQKSG